MAEDAKAQQAAAMAAETQPPPLEATPPLLAADPEAAKKDEKAEVDRAAEFAKVRKDLEEELETTITEADIKDYIFKGRLTKEVTIFPGHLRATFQTLDAVEFMEVDKRKATYVADTTFTSDGVANHQAIITLSYAWVAANGKPLAANGEAEKREKFIRRMGAITIDAASTKFRELNTLINLALNEKKFVKKS
jgi:hypothetical protein